MLYTYSLGAIATPAIFNCFYLMIYIDIYQNIFFVQFFGQITKKNRPNFDIFIPGNSYCVGCCLLKNFLFDNLREKKPVSLTT